MRIQLLIALFLAAAAVSAADVTLTPLQIYETTTNWESISIDNYGASTVLTSISAYSPNLTIQNAKNYTGWASNANGNTASWTNGSIETNVRLAVFEFQVTAPKITADYSVPVTITTDGTPKLFNLTILNDATPPNITQISPFEYARANNSNQQITIIATDDETDVQNVTYSWNNCANGSSNTVALARTNNTWAGNADFSGYSEGQIVCYIVNATNNGGESRIITGQLQFDGTPPQVTIISPTTYATQSTQFTFNSTDNIATELTCTVKFDTTNLTTLNAVSGATSTTTQNISGFSEGSHAWSVECQDGVGLLANDVQTVILDLLPPQLSGDIALTMPRTIANQFMITINDVTPIAVNATFEGSVVTLTQNGNNYTGFITSATLGLKELIITAHDSVGNVMVQTRNITFVPNHQLTLTLNPSIATTGTAVIAQGTLTEDGSANETTVTIFTPDQNISTALNGNTYSAQFTPTTAGTYTISARYADSGHIYTATAALQVNNPGTSSEGGGEYPGGSGLGFDAWRYNGYAVEKEPAPSSSSEQEEQEAPLPEKNINEPGPQYYPVQPEAPRQAITPKASGIFNLGNALNWLAPLLAICGLLALAAYAYMRRPPKSKKGGVDWDGYFDGS